MLKGFTPAAGGAFDVVSSSSLVGDFQRLVLPSGQVLKGSALSSVYQISAASLLSAPTSEQQQTIDEVLVVPGMNIARPLGSVVISDGLGEPVIEFIARRRASCN